MRITKDNINEFIKGTSVDCSNKRITHIEYIPDGITHLYFYYNQLTELPKLPESLTNLYCNNNKLTELPKLPESLTHLYCFNNQLTELPKLPESLTHLWCENNNLTYEVTIDNFKEHNQLIKRKKILSKICV
jgi:Leucine-rich repeat (LRR) protein